MSEDEMGYFALLVADIEASGVEVTRENAEDAFREAHARRQRFAQEMADGLTDRAKAARKMLAGAIYASAQIEKTMRSIEIELGSK